MRHIISLAALIVCTFSWVQSTAQGIVILDCTQDSFVLCAPSPSFSLPDNNQMIVGVGAPGATTCSGQVRLPLSISDSCGIIIRYFVDLIPFDGSDTVRLQDTAEAFLDINDETTLILDSKLFGNSPYSLNGIDYNTVCPDDPGGFHRLLWTVMDECGDLAICDFLMRLEDCVPPLVDAVGLSSVVMPSSGVVTLAAQDLIESVVDDCSPINWILHSFDSIIFTPTATFTCASIDENGGPTFLLKMWSADAGVDRDCNGSIAWGERNLTRSNTLIVIDQGESCGPVEPYGRIISENQVPVEGVDVKFETSFGNIFTVQTDADGFYDPSFINPLIDVDIIPVKGGDDSVGVSTLDLIKIQKHLLGIEPFDSPYKYIAADANNTESVSAADLLELRKLILRINHQHPNNESWRFIPSAFAFNNPNAPWPFDESIEEADSVGNDFIAVKIGDLNGSVTEPQFDGDNPVVALRDRQDPIRLITISQDIEQGNIIEIDITSDNFQDVIGFQYTIQMAGLDLLGIRSGKINITSSQFARHGNAVTMSWLDLNAVSADEQTILFTLIARANTSGMLSDLITINSSLTKAESYMQNGKSEIMTGIVLQFNNNSTPDFSGNISVGQNEPNPFTSQTTIPFNIKESGKVSLWVFSALGREVYFSSQDFPAGRNAFRVNFSEIEASGLMYYRVEKDGVVVTKKMVAGL